MLWDISHTNVSNQLPFLLRFLQYQIVTKISNSNTKAPTKATPIISWSVLDKLFSLSSDECWFVDLCSSVKVLMSLVSIPRGTRGFLIDFQKWGLFWGQIFHKGLDHCTVRGSENGHLTCTAKRQWILSGRSDQNQKICQKWFWPISNFQRIGQNV